MSRAVKYFNNYFTSLELISTAQSKAISVLFLRE